jgi:hypothetical protein
VDTQAHWPFPFAVFAGGILRIERGSEAPVEEGWSWRSALSPLLVGIRRKSRGFVLGLGFLLAMFRTSYFLPPFEPQVTSIGGLRHSCLSIYLQHFLLDCPCRSRCHLYACPPAASALRSITLTNMPVLRGWCAMNSRCVRGMRAFHTSDGSTGCRRRTWSVLEAGVDG